MAAALKEAGFELDETEIRKRIAAEQPIGRPHLAQAVLSAPANADRLQAEEIGDVGALIRGYLIEGKPAFRMRQTPTVAEAVEAIHEAGRRGRVGPPLLGHLRSGRGPGHACERFKALGMDGVEVFYITHTREQTELLARRCVELGLLQTGSADFHGPENRQFHSFLAFDTYGLEPKLGPIGAGSASSADAASPRAGS